MDWKGFPPYWSVCRAADISCWENFNSMKLKWGERRIALKCKREREQGCTVTNSLYNSQILHCIEILRDFFPRTEGRLLYALDRIPSFFWGGGGARVDHRGEKGRGEIGVYHRKIKCSCFCILTICNSVKEILKVRFKNTIWARFSPCVKSVSSNAIAEI